MDGKIAWLVTLQDSSGVCSDQAVIFAFIGSKTDESPCRHERTILLDGRNSMAKRELSNFLGSSIVEYIWSHHQGVCLQLICHFRKGWFKVAVLACLHDMQLEPQCLRCRLQCANKGLAKRTSGI